MMIECNDNCRHGLYCRNKAIQIGGEKITSIFVINNEELGLRSGTNIEAGSFIIEYVGEVIDRDEFNRRKLKMTHNEPFYFFKLSHQFYIDAKWKGNKSRFINHSCSPNAELSVFDVKGYMRAGFFATRNISLGEEITFSYGNSSNRYVYKKYINMFNFIYHLLIFFHIQLVYNKMFLWLTGLFEVYTILFLIFNIKEKNLYFS